MAQSVKNPPVMQEMWVQSVSREDPLEKEMATHSSICAWRIPWTEEPDSYSPWDRRVGHDSATDTFLTMTLSKLQFFCQFKFFF